MSQELLKTRNEVYGAMKNIMALSTRSESDFAKYDELEKQYQSISAQLEREVRFSAVKGNMEAVMDNRNVTSGDKNIDSEIRAAFIDYIRTGNLTEVRQLNTFASTEGGVNIPTVLFNTIQKTLADSSVMRRIGARVINTTSTTVLPLVGTGVTAVFKAENPSASYAETDLAFSSATLGAWKATALLKLSEELIQDASTDLEATIAAEIGTAFGNLEEKSFVSGSGVASPLGILRTTAAGGHNVLAQSIGSLSGSFLDNVLDGYYKMPGNRRQQAVYVVGDGMAGAMRKAKTSYGEYLWDTSVVLGQPDTFNGVPVYTTAAGPTTWQVGGVVGALLFPQHFVIGDRGGMIVTRLNELYAAEGNVGYRATKRFDCALTDGNSLVKFTAGAA